MPVDQSGPGADNNPSGEPPPFRQARSALNDLPDKILAMLRASPAGEIEQHVKALVAQTADRLDLVPREEFEIQQALVERLRERVEKLEAALADNDATKR